MPKCFILLVHYGDSAPTQKAVASLLGGTRLPNRIVVIDHGTEPVQLEENRLVRVIRPGRNEGYMAGLTVGIGALVSEGASATDVVVCMNNDSAVSTHTIARLVQWFVDNPAPALVGPKGGTVNLFTGRTRIQQPEADFYNLQPTTYNLTYVHGAFFAAPYAVLARIPMPLEYFLYWEDVAFSRTLQRRGVQLHVLKELDVEHADEEIPASGQKLYYLVRSGIYFLELKTPPLWRLYWFTGNRLRFLYHRFISGKSEVIRAFRDAHTMLR